MLSSNSYKEQSKHSDKINSDSTSKSFISSDFGPSINSSCINEVSISTLKCEQDKEPLVSYNKTGEIVRYIKDTNNNCFVILQLGNNENIKVASLLLSHASSLIERIVSKKKDKVCCINTKLFSSSHMKNIINFLKTGKIIFKIEDLPQLFAIVHRFEMSSICTLFETSLLSCVNSNKSLLTILLNFAADSQNLVSTKTKTNLLEMINYRLNDFIIEQHFFDLAPSALIFVLSSDSLKIKNEVDIMRIAVIFMDKVDCFGYADSMFNCIRFNHCDQEMLKIMKKELAKYGNKHLSFVFDCFNPDLDQSLIKHIKQSTGCMSRKNVNCMVKRGNESKESFLISNALKQMIDKLIFEGSNDINNSNKVNATNNFDKNSHHSTKIPQKFKVMPSTPNSLKKLRKSNKNKEGKAFMNHQHHSFSDTSESNPYRNLTDYNNRLFSADSIFEINKYQNAFDRSFNGDLYVQPFPYHGKEILSQELLEKNPYYYVFKDREQRKFSPESVYEIRRLSSNFINEDIKTIVPETLNNKENIKQIVSLDTTQCSSKNTISNEPISFTGKKFNINLPQHNELKN